VHTRSTPILQVLQTSDYYPFGLQIAAGSYQKQTALDNDYLYNGKELQDEHNLGWMDYGARMYDPAIGRWNHVDPMADKMRSNSPYNYAFNSPVMFVDPDGMFPIVIHVRSFAPYKSFGARGWHGDNRSFSLDPSASSRLTQRTHYETSTGQYSHRHSGNMSYSNYGAFAYSESHLNDEGSGNGQIRSHLYGNNDAIFPIGTPMGGDGGPTWDIDAHTSLKIATSELDDGNQLLSITGQISGDRFPNAEAYVTDAEGNQVWLGAFANQSGPDIGPFFTLAGDKNKSMINVNVGIVTDKNGIFTGVRAGDQTISIEQWNKDSSGPMSVDEFKKEYKDMYNTLFGNQE